ncbi:hypothetical protein FACS1894125_2590 [Actinomycetota bacterium]|nr:hypothetical protein FACS1894125_2590 [Actinomycetota bacterium]
MAQNISAEQGAIETGAKAVDEAHSNIDQHLKKVRGEIDSMAGYWKGDAAGAFTSLMGQFDEKGTKLNNILTELSERLRKTHQSQAQTEQAHQDATKSLLGALNG